MISNTKKDFQFKLYQFYNLIFPKSAILDMSLSFLSIFSDDFFLSWKSVFRIAKKNIRPNPVEYPDPDTPHLMHSKCTFYVPGNIGESYWVYSVF